MGILLPSIPQHATYHTPYEEYFAPKTWSGPPRLGYQITGRCSAPAVTPVPRVLKKWVAKATFSRQLRISTPCASPEHHQTPMSLSASKRSLMPHALGQGRTRHASRHHLQQSTLEPGFASKASAATTHQLLRT